MDIRVEQWRRNLTEIEYLDLQSVKTDAILSKKKGREKQKQQQQHYILCI